jgi:hypothetical protein
VGTGVTLPIRSRSGDHAMTDASIVIGRIQMLVLPPLMLVLPIALVMIIPRGAATDAKRVSERGMLVALYIATTVAIAVWAGFLVASMRFPWAAWPAHFSWMLFFPLWFVFAWPLIRSRNPAWEGAMYGPEGVSGAVRTASLVNRDRQNPVTRGMWAIAVFASVVGPSAIAARGLWPFPLESVGPGDEAAAIAQRVQWLVFLGSACLAPIGLLWLPLVLRSILREPEPMDAAGSNELVELYGRQRRRRVLGMFWLNGVAAPLLLGGIFALVVWFPGIGALWGIVGGLGGSALGIVGAVYGFMMTAERARIAEIRVQLDRSRGDAAG